MVKGPKGPRTKRVILDRIISLALDGLNYSGKDILEILWKEFPEKDVPGLRTIYYYVHNTREEAKDNPQEQPWSLAMMAKADVGIPWEAAGFLLEALHELRLRQESLQKEGKHLWHYSAHPLDDFYKGSLEEVAEALSSGREPERVSVKPLAPRAPAGTVLTNRQAKWLWRIHLIVPHWTLPDGLSGLCGYVDAFSHRELIADHLNEDFDTSGIDSSLGNLLRQIRDRSESSKASKQEKEAIDEERGKQS